MIYLLDTNVCVSYLRGIDRERLEVRLNATHFGDIFLCSVDKAELLCRTNPPSPAPLHSFPAILSAC